MAKKRFSAEQIINHLRQAEILVSPCKTIGEAVRQLGISEQIYHRWRRQYGGLDVDLQTVCGPVPRSVQKTWWNA
jgi:putative transposase